MDGARRDQAPAVRKPRSPTRNPRWQPDAELNSQPRTTSPDGGRPRSAESQKRSPARSSPDRRIGPPRSESGYYQPPQEVVHCPDRSSLVILVDWDDTLFPTSELLAKALLLDSTTQDQPRLPPGIAEQVQQLEQSVLDFLVAANTRGTLVIVTNAARGWIDVRLHPRIPTTTARVRETNLTDCVCFQTLTEWAMPRVGLYMARQHITVRYARECVGSNPHDVETWKQATFQFEAEQARARLSRPRPLSLVSVGDMPYERDAAHDVAEPDDTVKTIKFLEDPTLKELQHELSALVKAMPSLTQAGQAPGIADLEMHARAQAAPPEPESLRIPDD